MSRVSFDSPFYPYEKVNTGINSYNGIEDIPKKIAMYLLDLPDKHGYEPIDDNSRARVRLIKYIYYDCDNPLSQPLPTPEQKLSLLYNGNNAELTTKEDKALHPLGYRIMPQIYTEASSQIAKTLLKILIARVSPKSLYEAEIALDFQINVNYALENNLSTGTFSRMWNITQCLLEALNGVNITGVGVIGFNKASALGTAPFTQYHDEGQRVYGDLIMVVNWRDSEELTGVVTDYDC